MSRYALTALRQQAGWTLRQRRYATLAVAFFALMLCCLAAGTFELHRYLDKRHDNRVLRMNAAAAPVPLTTNLVSSTGRGAAPDSLAVRYRTVTASGTYDGRRTRLIGGQSQGGSQGAYVLTPLRTAAGDLLVVRGFVATHASRHASTSTPPAPSGRVLVSGRLQNADTSIDPSKSSAQSGRPAFQAWLALDKDAAGSAGMRSLPRPSLSNPTGGASEWQLLSYVVQWYVFALLALIAPFLFARAEMRATRRKFLDVDEDDEQFDTGVPGADPVATPIESAANRGGVQLRGEHGVARRDPVAAAHRLARAQRLADRYGRPLGPDPERSMDRADAAPVARDHLVRDSTKAAHRTIDEYHANYNDYLWQLALADGDVPEVLPRTEAEAVDRGATVEPRVIEAEASEWAEEPERDN